MATWASTLHSNNVLSRWWTTGLETYLDAVKICLELVHMALMGLSWPLTSPMGVKLSTFHTFSMPPRQPLSSMGRPGTYARAHTQSLWALGICCGVEADERTSQRNICSYIRNPAAGMSHLGYGIALNRRGKHCLIFNGHNLSSLNQDFSSMKSAQRCC